jgi:hypothetical protein
MESWIFPIRFTSGADQRYAVDNPLSIDPPADQDTRGSRGSRNHHSLDGGDQKVALANQPSGYSKKNEEQERDT